MANKAVFGLYSTRRQVENAVDELKAQGFRNTDISVMFPENVGTKDFAHEKDTKAPEGATTGAGTGAVIGGAVGWLAGIGTLAIPGVGPFIAAGPIILVGMGISEYEAKRYEGRVNKGGILLSVHSDDSDWTKKAKAVLERTGAEDISSTGETKGDSQNADRPMVR